MSSDQMPHPRENSLPVGQENTSNARGMPGEGMFKLRFDWYINYADFHRAGRMCFIPKLLNCSVIHSFEFIGELFKKKRALFPEGQNNEQLGVLGDKKSKLRIFRCGSLLSSRYSGRHATILYYQNFASLERLPVIRKFAWETQISLKKP